MIRFSCVGVDMAADTLASLISKHSDMLEVKPNTFALDLTPLMVLSCNKAVGGFSAQKRLFHSSHPDYGRLGFHLHLRGFADATGHFFSFHGYFTQTFLNMVNWDIRVKPERFSFRNKVSDLGQT